MKFYQALFLFVLTAGLLSSCKKEFASLEVIQGRTMGTTYTVKYVPLEQNRPVIVESIKKVLLEVNRQMSTYQQDSEITQFNM